MDIPTNYLINKDTERPISLVMGTRPFWTIGIDINGKSLFFILFNTQIRGQVAQCTCRGQSNLL